MLQAIEKSISLQGIAGAVSAFIAVVGLLFAWRNFRKGELRRDDVLEWANEAIEALETLLLLCMLSFPESGKKKTGLQILDQEKVEAQVADLVFKTATLVERGRLFFRNQMAGDYGLEKPPAYRGFRPAILDPIVTAHQIALAWFDADPEQKLRMRLVAEQCLRNFVSLAQKEVGRERVSSSDAGRGGERIVLDNLLWEVDSIRLAKLKAKEFKAEKANSDVHPVVR